MENELPDNVASPKPKRGYAGLVGLIAGLFGEDASKLGTFDFATLSFVGWTTLVSTFAVFCGVVALIIESHAFAKLPDLIERGVCGLVAVVIACAWFKFMRTFVEAVGLSLCKDSRDHNDGL